MHTPGASKGRAARSNRSGRYETQSRHRLAASPGMDPGPAATEAILDHSRGILSSNQSPDVPFSRSINPYRGCEHGCIYCFARPSHSWLGYSAGLDFETRIVYKPRAAELLRSEFDRPGYRCETIALGSNTDPYQPLERRLRITRRLLELLRDYRHPVAVVTKSALVERDLDLLADLAGRNLGQVFVSVTTLDGDLARRMEPRAASPQRRLRMIEQLAAHGVPVGVLVAPVIPMLNDHEIERVLAEARSAGARSAAYILLRLPLEIGALFEEWLAAHYPDRAQRVMARVRDTRGGQLYRSDWDQRMHGSGDYAGLLAQRFRVAAAKLGYAELPALATHLFRGARNRQPDLFDP